MIKKILIIASLFFSLQVFGEDCIPKCYPNQACLNSKKYGYLYSAQNGLLEPCQDIPWAFFADISFLVWQAKEDALEFTAKTKSNPNASLAGLNVNAKDVYLDFPWEPAFKICLGIGAYNNWDFQLRWTNFTTNFETAPNASLSPRGNDGLYPIWASPNFVSDLAPNDLYTSAVSRWTLNFNTLDIELSDAFQITKSLSLRLNGGLKGMFIDQFFRVRYSGGMNTNNPPNLGNDLIRFKNQVKGAGPRVGCDAKVRLGKGAYLLADGSASLLLQYYKLKRAEVGTDTSLANFTSRHFNLTLTQIIWTWKPQAQLELGLGWGSCLGKNRPEKKKNAYLGFEVSYEVEYFCEQSLFARLPDTLLPTRAVPTKGDLYLHGLNLSFNLEF